MAIDCRKAESQPGTIPHHSTPRWFCGAHTHTIRPREDADAENNHHDKSRRQKARDSLTRSLRQVSSVFLSRALESLSQTLHHQRVHCHFRTCQLATGTQRRANQPAQSASDWADLCTTKMGGGAGGAGHWGRGSLSLTHYSYSSHTRRIAICIPAHYIVHYRLPDRALT